MRGFLVVVGESTPGAYRGVDRVPTYPAEFEDEAIGAEQYALGDFKSPETNLIERYDQAVTLLRMFDAAKRPFEIIFCDSEDDESFGASGDLWMRYGHDVAAVTADYWSIVKDISRSDWAAPYRSARNQFGLFPDRITAENYLYKYAVNEEPDADAPLIVVGVEHVAFGI